MLEHLSAICVHQRATASSSLTELFTLAQWSWALHQLSSTAPAQQAPGVANSASSADSWWQSKDLLDSLLSTLAHLRLLYSQVSALSGEPAIVTRMTGALQIVDRVARALTASKAELDTRLLQLFPSTWLPR